MPYGFLASADVFVEDLRALDTNEVKTAFFRDSGCKQGLSATRKSVQKEPVTRLSKKLRSTYKNAPRS